MDEVLGDADLRRKAADLRHIVEYNKTCRLYTDPNEYYQQDSTFLLFERLEEEIIEIQEEPA